MAWTQEQQDAARWVAWGMTWREVHGPPAFEVEEDEDMEGNDVVRVALEPVHAWEGVVLVVWGGGMMDEGLRGRGDVPE